MPSGSTLPLAIGGDNSLMREFSCCSVQQGTGTAIPGPTKGRVGSAWPSDSIAHSSHAPLRWYINLDPTCIKTTEPNMAHSSCSGPADILALDGSIISQTRMTAAAAWPLDTNKASSCGPDPRFLCNFWWHHRSWLRWDRGPRQGPWLQQGLNITTTPDDSAGRSDWHGPSSSMGLRH